MMKELFKKLYHTRNLGMWTQDYLIHKTRALTRSGVFKLSSANPWRFHTYISQGPQ